MRGMGIWAYYILVAKRASNDSARIIKENVMWDGAVVIGALLLAWFIGENEALEVFLYALAVIGAACIIVFLWQLITAPARIHADQQTQIAELESNIHHPDGKKPGPYVLLKYESQTQKPIDPANFRAWEQWRESGGGSIEESQKPVILENISDIPALKVQVRAFSVGASLVEFPGEVPRLLKGEPQSIQPLIKDVGPMFAHQFGSLLESSWDPNGADITVSIMVSYRDMEDNHWETEHVLTYEYYRYQVTPKERRLLKD